MGESMDTESKLRIAKVALEIARDAVNKDDSRWTRSNRLSFIHTICDAALKRITDADVQPD